MCFNLSLVFDLSHNFLVWVSSVLSPSRGLIKGRKKRRKSLRRWDSLCHCLWVKFVSLFLRSSCEFISSSRERKWLRNKVFSWQLCFPLLLFSLVSHVKDETEDSLCHKTREGRGEETREDSSSKKNNQRMMMKKTCHVFLLQSNPRDEGVSFFSFESRSLVVLFL